MKKTVLALTAALMLTGCARPAPTVPPTTPPTTAAAETEPPAKTYDVANSPMERSTGGAVRTFRMEGNVTGLAMMGSSLLVCTDGNTLYLLDAATTEELRVRELESTLSWDSPDLRIMPEGLAYYDAASATYVTLDAGLVSGPSFVLSGKVMSQPLISSDFSFVYYVTEEGIRRMNLKEGTSRLLRQEHEEIVRLDGLTYGDSWLFYTKRRADGSEQTCFVDAGTGSMVSTNRFRGQMRSSSEGFAGVVTVEHAMGSARWVVASERDGAMKMLYPEPDWGDPLLMEGGRVLLQQRSKLGVELSCIDLASGTQLGRILLPQQESLIRWAGTDGETVWLSDGTDGRFYGWDLAATPEQPAAAVLGDFLSLASDGEAALEPVRAAAEALGEELGMEIVFSESGNRTEGIRYDADPDYRPMQYAQALERLRMAAARLPEGFLDRVRRETGRDQLRVELVDRYDPAWGPKTGTGSFDVEDRSARIEVDMCKDLESIFYHELFHVLEVQLRNDSDHLKQWDSFNPEGFAYGEQTELPDLPGGTPVADGHAMESGREDRAQLFMYACLDGQQDRFASETMQRKLRFLSELLRDLYDLEEPPVWEQYLLQPTP